jgi:CBS domain-containing protein
MVRRLPVIDSEGKLVGIVALGDIAREVEREVIGTRHEISAEEVTATLASVTKSGSGSIIS